MTIPLFTSSCVFGTILLGTIAWNWSTFMQRDTSALLCFVVLIGILTSLLNHGTDQMAARFIDRAFMVISGITFLAVLWDTRVSNRLTLIALMLAAVLAYVVAKVVRDPVISDVSHVATHGFATVFILATLFSIK
jgi:uncharacterized protein YqhQ